MTILLIICIITVMYLLVGICIYFSGEKSETYTKHVVWGWLGVVLYFYWIKFSRRFETLHLEPIQ